MKIGLPAIITVLIAAQLLCVLVFLIDVIAEFPGWSNVNWHFTREALATLALFGGIVFETWYLRTTLRRKASLERSVGLASSALQGIIESHFDQWKLTASERDIAFLLVKGLSIAEIAQVRGSAEGTVKAHLNAIYRKAKARNRAEVMSTIMDMLVDKPLLAPEKT